MSHCIQDLEHLVEDIVRLYVECCVHFSMPYYRLDLIKLEKIRIEVAGIGELKEILKEPNAGKWN